MTEADLASTQEALRLLSVLNDQFASAYDLAPSVEQMPALSARVTRTFHQQFLGRPIPSLANQLGALGNRRFEQLLFGYLEDLTELQATMSDPGA